MLKSRFFSDFTLNHIAVSVRYNGNNADNATVAD